MLPFVPKFVVAWCSSFGVSLFSLSFLVGSIYSHLSVVFLEVQGLYTAGEATRAASGPEFVEGLASQGFAARLWLRGVASPGFADVCSTNIFDVCAPVLLNQVESAREALSFRTRNMAGPQRGGAWKLDRDGFVVASRRLRGGFAGAS